MITADDHRTTLLTLYPLFKEEVYRRRQEMMRWTAIGSVGLIAILVSILVLPSKPLTWAESVLMGSAELIWCGLCCALIRQHQDRHRQAKQVLIQLEQALHLYETGLFLEEHSLYPQTWTSDWTRDKTGLLYYGTLGALAVLVLLALVVT